MFQQLKKMHVNYCGWGEDWELGLLVEGARQGSYVFEYSQQAIERGIEFSPYQLPLSRKTYSRFESFQLNIPGFIADSLPDGWGLLLMDRFLRRHHIDPNHISVLDRLAMMADDTMGALTYRPELPLPEDTDQSNEIKNLLQLAQEVRREVDGQGSEALLELIKLGGSPHGARPKALVEYDLVNDRMKTTSFEGSMPWLIKFPSSQEGAEVCALEYVYAKMAEKAGIDMPEAHYFNLGNGLSAFGVKRFDRVDSMRVPVLSMAGALHADFRLPSMDYADVLRATAMITRSVAQREIQLKRMIFNILMHNRDDHTKNFSFVLNKSGQWVVSPAYDLTFSYGPGGEHQTSVAGVGSDISRNAILQVAEHADIDAPTVDTIIEEVASVATEFYRIATELTDDISAAELKKVAACINRNLACLLH